MKLLSLPCVEVSEGTYCDSYGEAEGWTLTITWGRFGFQLWLWSTYG